MFGYLYLSAKGAISWKSVKQLVITISTMEVEFVVSFKAMVQVKWLWNFILGLGIINNIVGR